MINVFLTPHFLRDYKKLVPDLQEETREKIELFQKKDPRHPFLKTHPLKGNLKDRFSFSVNYDYRVIFRYDSKNAAALLAVGPHDLYDNL